MVVFETRQKNIAFKERGSTKFPDGKPIPGKSYMMQRI